jgi:hypothetical protein
MNFEALLKMNNCGTVNVTGCTFNNNLKKKTGTDIPISNTATNWSGTNQLFSVTATLQSGAVLTNTGNINLQSKTTFTNKSTLKSDANATFTVHPTATLVIDGGKFTHATAGTLWQGITVLGDGVNPLSSTFQGTVQILNNGIIENAKCGITAEDGGLVYASHASFLNNTIGVFFKMIASSQLGYNSGTFTQTTFILNNNYFGNVGNFEAHLKLFNSGKVSVTGCTFSSTTSNIGVGVLASNSDLEVKEYCPAGCPIELGSDLCDENCYIPSTFTGVKHGIQFQTSGRLPILKVRCSKFDNCLSFGIRNEGANYPEIIRNKFNLESSSATGFYQKNSTGYKIEENTFTDKQPATGRQTTGLYINDSGAPENEVYKNIYNNLTIAQQFAEKNSSQIDTVPGGGPPTFRGGSPEDPGYQPVVTGVQSLCNTFNYSLAYDILLDGLDTRNSIRRDQGSLKKSSGNEFNGFLIGPFVWTIDNTLSQHSINYYYGSQSNEYPPNVTSTVSCILAQTSNTCPSKLIFPPSKGGVFDLENALAQYDEMNREYEKWVDNLLTFDGDDEEGYNALLDMASYYSSLKDLFFNSIIITVMGGTTEAEPQPNTPQSNENQPNENQSESAQSESSEFEKFEQLRYLFSYRNHYTDNLSIVETYLAESNYSDALASLENIFNQFEVTDEQTNELTGLRIYTLWLQQLENANSNIYTLSDEDIVYLINYVETNTGRGVVFANNILCGLYGICIEEEGDRSQETGDGIQNTGDRNNEEMLNQSKSAQSVSSEFEKSITIVPNPTTGELQVTSYELQVTSIEVFDIYGRVVSTHYSLLTTHYSLLNQYFALACRTVFCENNYRTRRSC